MAKDFNQLARSGKRRSLDWEGYLMKNENDSAVDCETNYFLLVTRFSSIVYNS